MAEMAMQKPNASERRSRQARKGQDTEQTYVTAVKTGMARFRCFNGANGKCAAESTPDGVWQKWLCKSPMHLNAGAGRRERGKTLSKCMLRRLQQEWSPVQMQPKSSASEPGKNKTHTMQFIGHMQDTASLPKTHTVQMPMNQNKTEKRITNQAACHAKKNSGE